MGAGGRHDLRKALAEANEGIGFDWSGYKDQQDAVDPSLVAIQQHDQVNFLDLDISLSRKVTKTGNKVKNILRPYRKPGNSYAYILFTSSLITRLAFAPRIIFSDETL